MSAHAFSFSLSTWVVTRALLLAPIIPLSSGFNRPNACPCAQPIFLNRLNLYNYQKFKLLLTFGR
jgi:hypothetical protein